jgi:NADPH:quinone reductase-like Zn-dependent oxidoreductase
MKAVRFGQYGDIEVLHIADVPVPEPAGNQVLVKVKAASINPGEAKIRAGAFHAMWPATFPSGEGTDLAGVVTKLGADASAGLSPGDEVIGFTNRRASHAEYVVVEAQNLTPKPPAVSWPVAGSLAVAGSAACASVRAVSLKRGETVVVAGAAGGVGSIAAQLARCAGATVIGIAGPGNHSWLKAHGIEPLAYGEGLLERLRAQRIDAFIDAHGGGYVKMAAELGIPRERINTIIDFAAAQQYGVKTEGTQAVLSASTLAELARLVAAGQLDVPIAATFPLSEVRAAFRLLEQGHTRGKIVLLPGE